MCNNTKDYFSWEPKKVNVKFHNNCENTGRRKILLRNFVHSLEFDTVAHNYMQRTNIFFQCTTYIYSVHKCISECTNLFLSAQINFSVHKSISQCTNIFFSAQMYLV